LAIIPTFATLMNQRQLFLNSVAQTSTEPMSIEVAKAKGCYIKDRSGKRYLDLISGIAVSSLGHGNLQVVNAVAKQARKYMHTMVYGEHIQSPQVNLAQKIKSLLPPMLDSVYFVNSGSEAIEGALKLAKRSTRRHEFIAQNLSYHGSTMGAMSLMSDDFFAGKFHPLLPNIQFIEAGKFEDLDKITNQTAAVVIELVQAEKGVYIAHKEFVLQLRARCTLQGALLIIDEIQTGMGRTGTFFAFEQFNIIPDILVLAKSFGAGLPLGCFIASQQLMKNLQDDPPLGHITTFGGNPVCCAASLAGIKQMQKHKMVEGVNEKGELFKTLLNHSLIKEVRGVGLMLAVDFGDSVLNHKIIDKCLSLGLHVDWFLYNEQSMRICPPLIITKKQIQDACKLILKACDEIDNE
jgi:acetylornithine/N-succinyldiaminopimelate aminotransferase